MKKDKFSPVRRALSVGQCLSNVAYNIAQDDKIPEDWQHILDNLRREWDAVAIEARRALAPKKRAKKA